MNARELWERYCRRLCVVPSIGLTLDISRMTFGDSFFAETAPAMGRAFDAMEALEKCAIANPDEKRMVGHYWLRDPRRAPSKDLVDEISRGLAAVKAFAADVHAGKVRPPGASRHSPSMKSWYSRRMANLRGIRRAIAHRRRRTTSAVRSSTSQPMIPWGNSRTVTMRTTPSTIM